jgi:hypothetical protein
VFGDRLIEPDETFFVNLSNPTNLVLGRAQAVGTILNDDGVPGQLDHLEWGSIPSPQAVDQPFPVTLIARDLSNGLATNFHGIVSLTGRIGDPDAVLGRGNATFLYPLAAGYHDARTQIIYPAAELGGARRFTALVLDVLQTPGQTLNRFTVRLKHTPLNSYSSIAWETNGWTTAYQGDLIVREMGPLTLPFVAPFDYNGTNSLMVDFSFNNSYFTLDGLCRFTATNNVRTLYYQTDSEFGDPLDWAGTGSPMPSASAGFPNLQLIAGTPVAIQPPFATDFVDGLWSGLVTVREPATAMALRAEEANTATAVSPLFTVLAIPADADNDGLPDNWEVLYFGAIDAPGAGPENDPDRDGLSNRQEYRAGTNPLDPHSCLLFTSVRVQGGNVRLEFTTVAGRQYRVERTENLSGNSWSTVANNVPGTGAVVTVIDLGGATRTSRFYRASLQP